jgi:hypothetical protein
MIVRANEGVYEIAFAVDDTVWVIAAGGSIGR